MAHSNPSSLPPKPIYQRRRGIARGHKWCPSCQRELPESLFNKCAGRYDGLDSRCRECSAATKRSAWREIGSALVSESRCWYCGTALTEKNGTTDHIQPRARGGSNDPSNLVACCKSCNFTKNAHSLEEFREIRRRQRDNVPRFSGKQLAYLAKHGIVLPKGEPFIFWFERIK